MKKHHAILAIFLLLILAACPASTGQRTPLDAAKLTYVDASLGYEVAMQTVSALRFQHQVSDADWAKVATAERAVQRAAPIVAAGLRVWEESGSKPLTIDSALADMANALQTLQTIKTGAKP